MTREDILDDTKTFKPEAIKAVREFKALKTFREGTPVEVRRAGMQEMVNKLVNVYGLNISIPVLHNPTLEDFEGYREAAVQGHTLPIVFYGTNLSIITLLHQFAAIRKFVETNGDEMMSFKGRQRYAVNLFRKVYPRQFARLHFNGGMFTRDEPYSFEEHYVHLEGVQPPVEMQLLVSEEPDVYPDGDPNEA